MNEKEQKLLEGWSKLLGNPEVSETTFKKIEEEAKKKEKEKRLLEHFEKTLLTINTPKVEVAVVEESLPFLEPEVPETIEEAKFVDVAKANSKEITQPLFSPVEKQPALPEKDFVTKSVQAISKAMDNIPQKELPKTEEIPAVFRKEMDILKKSVMDLHSFASRISQMGGGGAGSIEELDFRTILVTTNYTANNKDYYIGVNCPTTCTITLPNNKKNGRHLIVKDESGLCSINNITVIGNSIDNDTTAVMGINNMALHFVYRNGWRII